MKYRLFLAYLGLSVKHGKAVRKTRILNPFMQIYSVQFLDCGEEELDQICGNIVADVLCIFDRQMDKATCHDIDPQVSLSLSLSLFFSLSL